MTKKSKLIMIAAIAAAVVLIVAGIIIAAVLSGGYLDSLKKYDVVSEYSYNGVEILEKDGLYYLTKDGKKLSKTGYTYLKSVNDEYFDEYTPSTLAEAEDFELYDWYVARKSDANTYFLVNSEGGEYAIAGESLNIYAISAPYVVFRDVVTYKYAAISLKNFDSALSSNAGEEISLNLFEDMNIESIDEEKVQCEYLWAYEKGDGSSDPKYIYVDVNGQKLFESIDRSAEEYDVYDEDSKKIVRFFLTGMKELYNIKGELVASDVREVKRIGVEDESYVCDVLKLACAPIDDTLTTEQNVLNEYVQFISSKTTFKLPVKEYDVSTVFGYDGESVEKIVRYDNIIQVVAKNVDGTVSTDVKLFNIKTGENMVCRFGVAYVDTGLIRIQGDEAGTTFAYVDTETGATLMQTKYNDMKWYHFNNSYGVNAALYSDAECAELNATAQDPAKAPKAYLHFVSTTKAVVNLTLAYNETIDVLETEKDAPVFEIVTTDVVAALDPNAEGYSMVKRAVYMPYASTAKTASYDKIDYLDIFADGIGVVLGIDYDGGKFDFIDAATGNVVKSVAAAGAEMAKISFEHYTTEILRQDNFVEESYVEYAIITMRKTNENGEQESKEWFVMSRNVVISDDEKLSTNAVAVTEIGKDLYHVDSAEGHLIVNTSPRTSTLYTVNDSYALEQVVSLPYRISEVTYYSNNIDEYYISVYDEHWNEGLYNVEGEQILAPIYNYLTVVDEEYIVACDKGALGAFKYNPKNGKVKQILDFKYEEIDYLSDGGFAVLEGTEAYLYEDGKLVRDDRIVNAYYPSYYSGNLMQVSCIYNWSVDEETGVLACARNYFMNFDGTLYIHRTEGEQVMVDGYYVDSIIASIENAGVKVVNFRNTDGSIIETKVIYPTAKSAFEFAMTETWYSTPVKKLQGADTVVSDVYIESISGNAFINLYKAHPVAGAIAG